MEKKKGIKVLHLTLKKRWFDMIASGEKKEEYREFKPYWVTRLGYWHESSGNPADNGYWDAGFEEPYFTHAEFRNGYQKNAPRLFVEIEDYYLAMGKSQWGAISNQEYFVIKLGNIINSNTNG